MIQIIKWRIIEPIMREFEPTPESRRLAQVIRDQRLALGFSKRQIEAVCGVNIATLVRLERGEILQPQPETLRLLADVLLIPVSDLFAAIGWVAAKELPTIRPYLRAKYRDMPDSAAAEIERLVDRLVSEHDLSGPVDGEDEH